MILYIHIGGEKDSFGVHICIYIYTSLPMDKVMTMVQSFLHMFALELELPNSGSGR